MGSCRKTRDLLSEKKVRFKKFMGNTKSTPSPYKTIVLRLPLWLFTEIKKQADYAGVTYQSLANVYIAERVRQEMRAQK